MAVILESHPWLTFSVDMRNATPQIWLLLGEAKSKCTHLAGVPLSTQVAKNLHEIFLAKGVHATAAIEGNTLSEEQVLQIIRGGNHAGDDSYEKREIRNIVEAVNDILNAVEGDGVHSITSDDIRAYNAKILSGLEVAEYVVPGEYAQVQVGVPGYRGVAPAHCAAMIDRLCDWLNSSDFHTDDQEEIIVYGIIKAVLSHLYLVWIHPFGDGNGRTARLLEARILLEAGVPSAACHLLSDHYNRTRPQYYKELAAASQSGGNVFPFMRYAIEGFVRALREQLLLVKTQQWSVSWINYVHDLFRGKLTKAEKRQRDLILALSSTHDGGTNREDARYLSPMLAEEYAPLTDKTVYRDLESLRVKGLAVRRGDRYFANMDIILQFLPRSRKGALEDQLEQAVGVLEQYGLSEEAGHKESPPKARIPA